jgi:hypothetical protein
MKPATHQVNTVLDPACKIQKLTLTSRVFGRKRKSHQQQHVTDQFFFGRELPILPPELLYMIFCSLSVVDLLNVSAVCHTWNNVSLHHSLWTVKGKNTLYNTFAPSTKMEYIQYLQHINLENFMKLVYMWGITGQYADDIAAMKNTVRLHVTLADKVLLAYPKTSNVVAVWKILRCGNSHIDMCNNIFELSDGSYLPVSHSSNAKSQTPCKLLQRAIVSAGAYCFGFNTIWCKFYGVFLACGCHQHIECIWFRNLIRKFFVHNPHMRQLLPPEFTVWQKKKNTTHGYCFHTTHHTLLKHKTS